MMPPADFEEVTHFSTTTLFSNGTNFLAADMVR
jgi:hypothetical protein